jgi:hypothetical protein
MGIYAEDIIKNPVKLNRPLNTEELEYRLDVKRATQQFDEKKPHHEMNVVQFNSTFVEIVDRLFAPRGTSSVPSLVGTVMGCGGIVIAVIELLSKTPVWWFILFMFALFIPFFCLSLWLLLKEWFAYTHYPVRLNRQNRMVYVWRKKGVLSVPWDKVHWFVRKMTNMSNDCWDIRGNVLAEDGVTVIDSFAFSSFESGEMDQIVMHFEYFRRYMENGPAVPYRALDICLPLAARKETWYEGLERLLLIFHGSLVSQILVFPIMLVISITRFIAMRTSRIPRWPAEVEAACQIQPNDPFLRKSGWRSV